MALPLFLYPPTTWILAAVTWALPLAVRAVVELESTRTPPGTLMTAFPERLKEPLALRSSTKIEGPPMTWEVVPLPPAVLSELLDGQ